jgi:hypothetical protein
LRIIAIAIAVFLASLPCFGQEPQVVVEQVSGEVIQVSTAADSPNLTRITGNVTINYYRCSYVTYCGSSQVSSAIGGYSVAGSTPNWYIPPTIPGIGSSFTSQPLTTEIQAWALGSSRKPGVDAFGAGVDGPDISAFGLGVAANPYLSTELKLIGSAQNDDGIFSSSPINKFTSTSYSFAVTSPSSITSQPIGSDRSNVSLLVGAAFAYGQRGIVSSLIADGASDYSYPYGVQPIHIWHDYASSTQPYEVPNSLFLSSINSVLGASSGSSDSGSTIFPDITNPSAGTGILGGSSTFLQTGSRYKSATGFDADSLTKQLADFAEQKRTVVGWTLLTEEDSKTVAAH